MTMLTQRLLRAIRASKLPDKAILSAIVDAENPKPAQNAHEDLADAHGIALPEPEIENPPKRRGRPPKYQTRVMKAE